MDQSELNSGLEKIRGGKSDVAVSLTDGEALALSKYLSETVSQGDVSEAGKLLCEHIRATLQARAVQARLAATSVPYKRTNVLLRDVIERFVQGEFRGVTEKEHLLLRETQSRLEAMAENEPPSENQIRLLSLVTSCMASYEAWRTS